MRILPYLLATLTWISATAWSADFYDEDHWAVAARPHHVRSLAEPSFVLDERVRIVADDRADADKAALLAGHIRAVFGPCLITGPSAHDAGAIVLRRDRTMAGHREQYGLRIDQNRIAVTGVDGRALYNGLGTLFTIMADQRLLPSADGTVAIPAVEISDWPAMTGFRGLNLQMTYRNPNDERSIKAFVDAMFRLHYNTVLYEIGKNWQSDTLGASWGYTRAQIRELLSYAKARGMKVIPGMNLLGHPGHGPEWPVKVAGSIDLRAEENYRLLGQMLDEIAEDFGHPKFFHGGMDEASKEMRSNAEKHGATERDLLATHVRKVNDLVKARGMRLIVWHDMLVADGTTGEVDNGRPGPEGTAAARSAIPRDVIINVWDYNVSGGRNCTRIFQDEGFEVTNIGWMDVSIAMAATVAHERSTLGMITGIWSDSTLRDRPTHNMYWTNEHRQRILALAAHYSWYRPDEITRTAASLADPNRILKKIDIPFDPALMSIEARWDRPARMRRKWTPIDLSSAAKPRRPDGFAPRIIDSMRGKIPVRDRLGYLRGTPLLLTRDSFVEIPSRLDIDLATPPRSARGKCEGLAKRRGKVIATFTVTGFDRLRGTNDLIVYTPKSMRTGANIYGYEIIVANGEVIHPRQRHNSGNSRIPRNGFVISAHGASRSSVRAVRAGDTVQLFMVDGGKREPVLSSGQPGPAKVDPIVIPLGLRPAKRLVFLQTTRYPTLPGRSLGHYEIELEGGKTERVDIVFAKNIGAFNETTGLFDPLTSRATWLAYSNYGQSHAEREPVETLYAHGWMNPTPGRRVTAVQLVPSGEALKTGLILLGITCVP